MSSHPVPAPAGGEQALWQRLAAGDGWARDALIRRHMALVVHLAGRLARGTVDRDDLVQTGAVGLIKAVDRFDSQREIRFSTYAVPMILGEMKRYLRNDRALRVSRQGRELARSARQARHRLAQELGREPALHEIAAAVRADADEVLAALEATRPPLSLFQGVGPEEGESTLLDRLAAPEAGLKAGLARAELDPLLDTLSPRERRVLLLRHLADRTQQEIAELEGISQGQVSRILARALAHLRDRARNRSGESPAT